jgi:hypothetical protein
MWICQFQSMLSPNRVEPGDRIVSFWTREGDKLIEKIFRGIIAGIDYSQMMSGFVCSCRSIKTYRVPVVH